VIFVLIYFYLFRLSKWNDTKIFSDFGDDESEGSDVEYMDASTMSDRWSKGSSQLKSKASLLRAVGLLNIWVCLFHVHDWLEYVRLAITGYTIYTSLIRRRKKHL